MISERELKDSAARMLATLQAYQANGEDPIVAAGGITTQELIDVFRYPTTSDTVDLYGAFHRFFLFLHQKLARYERGRQPPPGGVATSDGELW